MARLGALSVTVLLGCGLVRPGPENDALGDVGCLASLVGNQRYPAGTLVEGNCGFDFQLGLPVDAPNCPKTFPIALVLVPKCASIAFLNWIAKLDRTVRRWVELVEWFEAMAHSLCIFMSECPEPLTRQAELINSVKLISMMNDGEPPRGTQGELSTPEGMAETYVRFGRWVREGLLPLPRNCVRCCAGEGRTPVVVLRNPFARLMAYFQRAWLGSQGKAMRSMEEFPLWVEALGAVHGLGGYAGALQRGEGIAIEVHGRAVAFDVQDLYHTRPASHLLASLFPAETAGDLQDTLPSCRLAECWFQRQVFAVHTESIAQDLRLLQLRLCVRHQHCRALPSVMHLNTRSPGQQEDAREFWHSAAGAFAMRQLHEMYADDFALGSYSANASVLTPSIPEAADLQAFVDRLDSG